MWEEIRNVFTALAILFELPFGADHTTAVFLTAAPKGFHLNGFAIERIHLGLIIKRIHLARPTVHEQKNHVLGLGRQRRVLGLERIIPRCLAVSRVRLICQETVLRHHAGKGERGEATTHLMQKFTPRSLPAKRVHRFFNIRHKPVSI